MIDLVGAAIGVSAIQASLYDVPGGYRAVLFDRFSGVRPAVSLLLPADVRKCEDFGKKKDSKKSRLTENRLEFDRSKMLTLIGIW